MHSSCSHLPWFMVTTGTGMLPGCTDRRPAYALDGTLHHNALFILIYI